MKKFKLIFFLSVILLGSCAPPQPKIKIIKEENGLKCDSIGILYMNNLIETPVVVPLDSTLEMVFKGLTGFREKNDIVYPGGTLKVIDENGEVIFTIEDVFISLDETGADKKKVNEQVSMILETGSPMKKGFTYTWENTIWDKRANRKIIGKTKVTIE